MNRSMRVILIALVLVGAVGVVLIWSASSRNRNALAKYKAELRAKGEKLSAAELGYPHLPEPSESLDQLQAGLGSMARGVWQPGMLKLMRYVSAGRAQVCWAEAQPQVYSWAVKTNSPTWEDLTALLATNAESMAEIREATQHPPRWFYNDPTNLANRTMSPFVTLRSAAQALADDAVVALHARELDRAQADLHALTQLAQFYREDYTLVSQMMREAIAGLGLAVTWEAVALPGWSEAQLAALQKDWGAVSLSDTFERGIIGERAFGEDFLSHMRSASFRDRAKYFKGTLVSGRRSAEDFLLEFVAMPVWRANSDTDELFYIQHLQESLDIFRQLQRGTNIAEVNRQFKLSRQDLDTTFSPPLARFRYMYSAIALPNYSRAGTICVRNETLRRLAVTAIAVERYRLRNGRPPPDLAALLPHFLTSTPLDLMNAKPLGYKLNADGRSTLYSIGEDGRDDGGDAISPGATNNFDLWSGKDAVWPAAVSEIPEAE